MKILLLADPSSIHTLKWVRALSQKGIKVFLFGMNNGNSEIYENLKNVKFAFSGLNNKISNIHSFSISKIIYFSSLLTLKKVLKEFDPDIVHAHYASSYGLLGAILNHKNFVVSVWGTDVMKFPQKNFIFKNILKFVFKRSLTISASGKILAAEAEKYTDKKVNVIGFGIDPDRFVPKEFYSLNNKKQIILGTVKNLEKNSNIKLAIDVLFHLKKIEKNKKFILKIAGEGSQKEFLQDYADSLGLQNEIEFAGKLDETGIDNFLENIDVYLSLYNEGFGVALLEAMAAGNIVIASDQKGNSEIVENEVNGISVNIYNTICIAQKIVPIIYDRDLQMKLRTNAKDHVIKFFDFKNNVRQMIDLYNSIINKNQDFN